MITARLHAPRNQILSRPAVSFTPAPNEIFSAAEADRLFPMLLPRFLCQRIDWKDPNDPLRMQLVPRREELRVRDYETTDPLSEASFSPVPRLVHRYPDRAILKVSDVCALHCRFCFRKGLLGSGSAAGGGIRDNELAAAARYLAACSGLRELLLTGGDPLMLSDRRLKRIMEKLRSLRPDLCFRIGTRVPVAFPGRLTERLADLLAGFRPLRVSLHVNHPAELSLETRAALTRLRERNIPVLSQTVLLRGINDRIPILERLFREFGFLEITPYYLFALDPAPGTAHFRVPLTEGLTLMEALAERLPALPVYAVDLPGGGGKVPVAALRIDDAGGPYVRLTDRTGKTHLFPDGNAAPADGRQKKAPA